MKKIIFILINLFLALGVYCQHPTKYVLPYDSVLVLKPDGTGYLKAAKGNFADSLWHRSLLAIGDSSQLVATTEWVKRQTASASTVTKVFNSVADLRASNFYTTSGSIMAITLGVNTPNDGGGGNWAWISSSSTTDNTGLDVKPTAVSGNGRWERIYDDKVVNVKWFGLIDDGVTDNLAAWTLLWASVPRQLIALNQYSKGTILFPAPGAFYFSDSLLIDDQVTLLGENITMFPFSVTDLIFPANKSGLVLQMGNPNGGARGCYVSAFHIRANGVNTDTTKHGLRFNSNTSVNYVYVSGFGGNGIYANTIFNGNLSGSVIYNCAAQGNGLNGICIDGGESTSVIVTNANSQFNGRCNIRDNGFLGSWIYGGLTSGAGIRTGYTSDAIAKIGTHYYVCKRDNINKEPTVAVDWQDYWEDVGTSLEDPSVAAAWSSGTTYFLAANYASTGAAQGAMVYGLYRESGTGSDVILGGSSGSIFGQGARTFNNVGAQLDVSNTYFTVRRGGAGFSVLNKANNDIFTNLDNTFGLQLGATTLSSVLSIGAFSDTTIRFSSAADNVGRLIFTGAAINGAKWGVSGSISAGLPIISKFALSFANVRGSSNYASIDSIRKFFYTTGTPFSEGLKYGIGDFGMYMKGDSSIIGIKAMSVTGGGDDAAWAIIRSGNNNGDQSDTTNYKPAAYGLDGKLYKMTYWPGSGGGSTLFGLTGSNTATGDVTGDISTHTLLVTGTSGSYNISLNDGTTQSSNNISAAAAEISSIANDNSSGATLDLFQSSGAVMTLLGTSTFTGGAGDTTNYVGESYIQKDWALNRKVDTIFRTAGKDSIQFYINGRYHAIKDSSGSGASGITGSLTSGRIPVANGSSSVTDYAALTFDGTDKITLSGSDIRSNSGSWLRLSPTNGTVQVFTSGASSNVDIYNSAGAASLSSGYNVINTSGQNNLQIQTAAAGNVIFGSGTANTSAKVEISSTTKGFLPPRMTTTQRDAISSPATGLIVFCTDCTASDASTGVNQTYNGSTWKNWW